MSLPSQYSSSNLRDSNLREEAGSQVLSMPRDERPLDSVPPADSVPQASHWLDELSSANRDRLASILDAYLTDVERGVACNPADLVRQHADLATPLQLALDGLKFVNQIATSLPSVQRATPLPELGDYQIIRELGRGGMGIVYQARQESLGRMVALKVLPFAAVLEPNQVTRFQNEAQAAAQLDHPHIVPVYAVGCERGIHYYSMQYIDGQSLEMALCELRHATPTMAAPATGETPPEKKNDEKKNDETNRCGLSTKQSIRTRNHVRGTVELVLQAANALHYAHECGIIHRDIKPSNLLLDRRGKLWITDFGLARCRNQSQLTTNGQVCGTMRYMSPEQAAGRSAWIDHRTDIYALGVTLFELLTLRTPFDADDRETILRQINDEEPALPRSLNRAIPVDLETIVLKAIAKSREDRYTTANEFAADLRRFLAGQPTLARRPTWQDRVVKWAARRSKLLVASALVMLVAVGILSVALVRFASLNKKIQRTLQESELHLGVARATVDDFSAHLSEELAVIPGTETVRLAALERAQSFYQQFAEYAGNDARWRRDAALARAKQGAVLEKLNRLDAAETAYRQAQVKFADLLSQTPGDRDVRTEAALCTQQLAMLLIRTRRLTEGLHSLSVAEADLKQLILEQPSSRELRTDLLNLQVGAAVVLHNLGSELNDQGQFAESRQTLQQALEIRRELHRREPLVVEYQSGLAATLNNLGTAWLDEKPDHAARYFAEARELKFALLPGDYTLRTELAVAMNNQGIAAERLAIWKSSAAFFQEAIEQQEMAIQLSGQQERFKDLLQQYRANYLRVQQRVSATPMARESSATL